MIPVAKNMPIQKFLFCRRECGHVCHKSPFPNELLTECITIYAIGPAPEHIFGTFDPTKKAEYEDVIKQYDEHFVPKTNIIHERAKFQSRVSKVGENVETFIRALYELAENCAFDTSKNDMIHDSIVIGLLAKSVSQQLQTESSLTLNQAISKARHSEMIKAQLSESPY